MLLLVQFPETMFTSGVATVLDMDDRIEYDKSATIDPFLLPSIRGLNKKETLKTKEIPHSQRF